MPEISSDDNTRYGYLILSSTLPIFMKLDSDNPGTISGNYSCTDRGQHYEKVLC